MTIDFGKGVDRLILDARRDESQIHFSRICESFSQLVRCDSMCRVCG